MAGKVSSVDEYVASLPPEVLPVFEDVRRTIRAVVPGAEETIAYDIPTWRLSGRALVHLGAWKEHLSLYPVPEMGEDLGRSLAANVSGRGTLKFPLADPMPLGDIGEVVRLLVDQRTVPDP